MSDNFMKADDTNLPKLDLLIIANYLKKNEDFNIGETSGWKAGHSMRQSYVNTAIGWVDVKKTGSICIVRCKICPEHNVRNKLYVVECVINEELEDLVEVKCYGCAASEGGCKHATAFLMWLCERSMTPSVTEVQCYWKKPALSNVSANRVATLQDFGKPPRKTVNNSAQIVDQFLNELPSAAPVLFSETFLAHHSQFSNLNLHHMALFFKDISEDDDVTADQFISFLRSYATQKLCEEACQATDNQSSNPLWSTLRYGRVTASNLHEISHARDNKSLKLKILGAPKIPLSKALERGKNLEENVREEVLKQLKIDFKKTGLMIDFDKPHFGASPDGVSFDSILEIKCPAKERTVKKYVNNGKATQKVKAQMQLQMKLFQKSKGILAVADPNFETNKKIIFVYENLDSDYIENLISAAHSYWAENMFPSLFMIQ